MADNPSQDTSALKCECRAEEIILLPCSGGSNCGQIANEVAVRLTQAGAGTIYCLAGIGAHVEGMVESAKGAKRIVALDGCSTACAKKVIEHAGLTVTDWICVTEAGISKNHQFRLSAGDIALITQHTRELLSKPVKN